MEILKFLLSFFMEEYGGKDLNGVFKLLEENSFDIKKTIKNLTPETAAPIIKAMMSGIKNKGGTEKNVTDSLRLDPISSFADREIVDTLNKYFS